MISCIITNCVLLHIIGSSRSWTLSLFLFVYVQKHASDYSETEELLGIYLKKSVA